MNINFDSIDDLGYAFFQLVLVLVILFVTKAYRAMYTKGVDDFALMQDHKISSAGISMFGFLAGITIIIALAFGGHSVSILDDTIQILITAFIGMILLSLNSIFVDGLILMGFGNKKVKNAINANVLSIGVLQAFGFISAAVQFYFANQGVEHITMGLFMISVPYFIFGQFIVVAGMAAFIAITSYDDHKELFDGNVAVAISHGFLMLSISAIVGTVSSQALSIDTTTALLIVVYSILSVSLMIFGPKLLAGKFLNGVLKSKYDGKIEKAVADGQVDIAAVYGLMRLIVAIVIASSFPFNIFTV
jgi:uncharacterized membrane protein YjfL (UPF0719 family)